MLKEKRRNNSDERLLIFAIIQKIEGKKLKIEFWWSLMYYYNMVTSKTENFKQIIDFFNFIF